MTDIKINPAVADSFDDIRRKLAALPGMLDEQVIGAGLAAQARVVVRVARKTAAFRDQTGRLRASFRARTTSSRPERIGGRRVSGTGARVIFGGKLRGRSRGVIVAAKAAGRRAYHVHLVEFGHKGGYRKRRDGKRIFIDSSASPHPFIVPAIESSSQQQLVAAQKAMEKSMAKLAFNLKNNRLTSRQRTALNA